jgi:hypothetical protein
MNTNERSGIRWIYAAVSLGGSVAFLIGSMRLAWQARQYQVSGKPMPNGKGGFMTSGDGYLLAIILLLFSVACIFQARRFFSGKSYDSR